MPSTAPIGLDLLQRLAFRLWDDEPHEEQGQQRHEGINPERRRVACCMQERKERDAYQQIGRPVGDGREADSSLRLSCCLPPEKMGPLVTSDRRGSQDDPEPPSEADLQEDGTPGLPERALDRCAQGADSRERLHVRTTSIHDLRQQSRWGGRSSHAFANQLV